MTADITNITDISNNVANPDWQKSDGLLPVVVQNFLTKDVLMLGYFNEEAYQKTVAEMRVTFFSRSKGRLWTKGETSGNYLNVVSIELDCDNDCFLVKCDPVGPTCHTGEPTCFFKGVGGTTHTEKDYRSFLFELERIIQERAQVNDQNQSYTAKLLQKGIDKVAQKVGEEAVEVVIASKNTSEKEFLSEVSDLVFHLLVLLKAKKHSLNDVLKILWVRHQGKK